jgi:SAM-dependent methyltransferase
MAVAHRAEPDLEHTRRAFDAVAPEYDAANRRNAILERMRARSLAALTAHAVAGAHVLDLGCGPGTDFDALVDAGFRVTAVDGSAAMVDEARRRARAIAQRGVVQVHRLGIEEIDRLPPSSFDAAYSSFGPLNCVPSLDRVAGLLASRLRPGAVLVASVIGRVCPWEIACYAWKRDWSRLKLRFAEDFVAVPLGGERIWTRYYSPAEFERPFNAAGFRRASLRALAVLVPPPYMVAATERHRGLTNALQALEDRVAHWPAVRSIGDHFLIALRRS